jgi:hypothetical protein
MRRRALIALPIGLLLQITAAVHQPTATRTPTPAIETYRVVLKDGTQYVTREPYRAHSRFAVFTLSNGQLVSIPLESVDQQATREVNLRLHSPAPAPVGVRRSPVRIVLVGTPAPTVPPSQNAGNSSVGFLRFSGRGQEATNLFSLTSGLYVFRFHYVGQANFVVYLINESGREIGLVANEIGDSDGSKAVRIERSGKYLLNVRSDGDWSISVARPD